MARNISFPLKMRNKDIRTFSDLVEYFDLEKVLSYLKDGKLEKWLHSRGCADAANAIHGLDCSDVKTVCKILLPADRVAFAQDDFDILNLDSEKIYLYGTEFTLPMDKESITYIGLNHPRVNVDSENAADWKKIIAQTENCGLGNKAIVLFNNYKAIKDFYNDIAKRTPEELRHTFQELEEIAKTRFELFKHAAEYPQNEKKATEREYYEAWDSSQITHSYEELKEIAKTRFEEYAIALERV